MSGALMLAPDPNERWNYHQTLEIYRGNKCIDRGVCMHANWDEENGYIRVSQMA